MASAVRTSCAPLSDQAPAVLTPAHPQVPPASRLVSSRSLAVWVAVSVTPLTVVNASVCGAVLIRTQGLQFPGAAQRG